MAFIDPICLIHARIGIQMKSELTRSTGRPSPERANLIDREILETALQQFKEHGAAVSMTQMITRMGMSKTTVYSRFPSKRALFRAVVRWKVDMALERMALRGPSAAIELSQGLARYVEQALGIGFGDDYLEVNRLVFSERNRVPRLTEGALEWSRICLSQLENYIAARASIDGVPCRSPAAVAETIVCMMRGYYAGAMLSGEVPSPQARRDWASIVSRTILASRDEW